MIEFFAEILSWLFGWTRTEPYPDPDRDFARADFRLDRHGRPHFLEMNPLPTFAPDGSFGIIAELLGRRLEDLLAEILGEALVRLGL